MHNMWEQGYHVHLCSTCGKISWTQLTSSNNAQCVLKCYKLHVNHSGMKQYLWENGYLVALLQLWWNIWNQELSTAIINAPCVLKCYKLNLIYRCIEQFFRCTLCLPWWVLSATLESNVLPHSRHINQFFRCTWCLPCPNIHNATSVRM